MRRRIYTLRIPGRIPYQAGLEAQRGLARAKIEGRLQADWMLLLEHEPVVTLGRGTRGGHRSVPASLLAARGIPAVEIERGGDVTYHGPGQLVGYPILDLRRYGRDLHAYLRRLEGGLIAALDRLGVPAFRMPGYTGVWVGGDPDPDRIPAGDVRKIASIGVHVSRWVTWHGFALNVRDVALANFGLIVPCGIEAVRMTSLESEGVSLASGVHDRTLREAILRGFAASFETPVEEVPWEERFGIPGADAARAPFGALEAAELSGVSPAPSTRTASSTR